MRQSGPWLLLKQHLDLEHCQQVDPFIEVLPAHLRACVFVIEKQTAFHANASHAMPMPPPKQEAKRDVIE